MNPGKSLSDSKVVAHSSTLQQSIQVNVSLSKELLGKLNKDAALFVFAKAEQGSPMPLAVYRGLAKDLPASVTLDDSMAMVKGMALSDFPKIIVGARLSGSGKPQGEPGDYEGFFEVIELSMTPVVDIKIDTIQN